MVKSENLSDKIRLQIVREELDNFKKLIAGHRELLEAMGKL